MPVGSDLPLEAASRASGSRVLSARTIARRGTFGGSGDGPIWSARQSGDHATWDAYPQGDPFQACATNAYDSALFSPCGVDQYGVAAQYKFYAGIMGAPYRPVLNVFA